MIPRLVGPLVLMFLVLATLPVLRPGRGGGRTAGVGALGLAVLTVVFGLVVGQINKPGVDSPVPGARGPFGDPALIKAGMDWPAYGGSDAAQRYSPLNQINKDNVGQLERAWTFRTGDLPGQRFGAETTPLKIADTIYLCSARNKMFALDANTGKQKWAYDPKVPDDQIPYTAACRGVTYYAVPNADQAHPCATRIIEGTLDGRIIAHGRQDGRALPRLRDQWSGQHQGRDGRPLSRHGVDHLAPRHRARDHRHRPPGPGRPEALERIRRDPGL